MSDFSQQLAAMENSLAIDEHKLDDCLVEQAQIFWEVAKNHAIAVSDRDSAKKNLLDIEAEVDSEIRKLARNREERITEKEIESIKRVDPRVGQAARKLSGFGQKVALLEALKEAFRMRSYVLKDLVQLFIANYYEEASQDKVQKIKRVDRVERRRDEIARRYSNG